MNNSLIIRGYMEEWNDGRMEYLGIAYLKKTIFQSRLVGIPIT